MSVTFESNKDGSVIVKLSEDVKVGSEVYSRAVIPAISGKIMRLCPFEINNLKLPLGQLVSFAADIITPAGIVDEMNGRDAIAVAIEVGNQLGKSQATTELVSP